MVVEDVTLAAPAPPAPLEGRARGFGAKGIAVKLALAAVFLLVAFRQVNSQELGELIRSGTPGRFVFFGAALAISVACAILNAWKWWILLRGACVSISFSRVLRHYLVGYFLNNILTGLGEVKRTLDVGHETGEKGGVLVSVFLERWTGVTAQFAVSLVSITAAAWLHPSLAWLALLNSFAFLGLLALYGAAVRWGEAQGPGGTFPDPQSEGFMHWKAWLRGAGEALARVQHSPRVLGVSVLASILVSLAGVACHVLLALGMGLGTGAAAFALVVPIAWIFGQAPISFNGLGVQEVAYLGLFGVTGMTPAQAMALSIGAHGLKLGVGALGGLASLAWGGFQGPMPPLKGNTTERRRNP